MLTEAPLFASFCLTEPDAGSDVSGMRTTAVRKGDKWVINGSKCFITNGGYASFFTVYAKTDKEKGHRGISCFIVPKDDTVTVDKKEDKMGQRASNTATITFNDTEIPLDHLIGEENKGFKLAMMTLDRTRPGVAAMAIGIARAAFEFATAYSKERVQFGVPIAMHQGIQFLIADMATKVHLSRLAAWHSAVLLDQGKRNTLESSHAKRFAADSAMEVTTDAVQVYGGYGFIKDYPVEKLMRDAKIMQLYEGTSQIQRLVIARETLLPRRIEEPAAGLVASIRTRPRRPPTAVAVVSITGGAVLVAATRGGDGARVVALPSDSSARGSRIETTRPSVAAGRRRPCCSAVARALVTASPSSSSTAGAASGHSDARAAQVVGAGLHRGRGQPRRRARSAPSPSAPPEATCRPVRLWPCRCHSSSDRRPCPVTTSAVAERARPARAAAPSSGRTRRSGAVSSSLHRKRPLRRGRAPARRSRARAR